jgi:pSer/pThr/pTyr-binding forkhead associated (FHA) protein
VTLAYVVVTLHGTELQRRKLEGTLSFGRSLEADVTVEDGAVSRKHCQIEPVAAEEGQPEQWRVVDLQSRNGTRLNGKSLTEPKVLKSGDVIAIGHTKIGFHAGKFIGPRPADPAAALLSDTTIIIPSPRRDAPARPLPTPRVGRVDVKPPPQQAPDTASLPFTRPPARPIVKPEE